MKFSNLYCLCVGALCAITSAFSVHAGTVYFDNSGKKWSTPYVYYWGGQQPVGWPGVAMNKVDGQDNLWSYDIPAGNNSIIFNIGSNSDQTGNLIYQEKHVYTESGDTGKTLEEYLESLPDPAPDPDPTENVYVYLGFTE